MLRVVRFENRTARRLKRLSTWFSADASRRLNRAVEEYRAAP